MVRRPNDLPPSEALEEEEAEEFEEKLKEYRFAARPKPFSEVEDNLLPNDNTKHTTVIQSAMIVDQFKYFHKQEMIPMLSYNIHKDLMASATKKGKVVHLHLMEFNGSWKTPSLRVCIKWTPKSDAFYVPNILDSMLGKMGIGKEKIGDAALLITDLKDQPIYPHMDSFIVGQHYVVHVAPKHVLFIFYDDTGYHREILQPVVYGEPTRELIDRLYRGLGLSVHVKIAMMRDDKIPFSPEFKNFRFSADPNKIDRVTVITKKRSTHAVWCNEYPVERLAPAVFVSFSILCSILSLSLLFFP
jgi:hypothetical protein